jgi:hypothetical protein
LIIFYETIANYVQAGISHLSLFLASIHKVKIKRSKKKGKKWEEKNSRDVTSEIWKAWS